MPIERKVEKQTIKMSLLYAKNLKKYFLTHFNVKTKIHIVVKICIRISMMVMKGAESSSRAKKKVCRAKGCTEFVITEKLAL